MLSIIMADFAGGLTGFFVSTFVIVIFGEIIPQASCSRYALEVSSGYVGRLDELCHVAFGLNSCVFAIS